eukprot:TRINITY_DN115_c0_g1_i1.p1 TRINITY_DN115_c0_g1~~TRINITY_DN115_c0_g1_i1.p1  ORF type:complete len:580 (-),score=283.61 TRINITY_DN115_c0_g1_i1:323-2023(-)
MKTIALKRFSFIVFILLTLNFFINYCFTINLIVTPSVVSNSLDNITINWSGVTQPNEKDFVAIYVPSINFFNNENNWIGYILLNNSNNWKSGSGSIQIPLVNAREDYIFALWTSGGTQRTAISNSVTFINFNEPLQAHLQRTKSPTEMRLIWITAEQLSPPIVQFGVSKNELSFTAQGQSVTYNISLMCDAPANSPDHFFSPGYIHEVLLTGLVPSKQYFYRFGGKVISSSIIVWSDLQQFYSAPQLGSSVEIFVFGDLGVQMPFQTKIDQQGPSIKTTRNIRQVMDQKPNQPWLVIHIGDISYARGYAFVWEWFFAQIEPIATQAPWMVAIGNHEFDWPGQTWKPNWTDYGTDSGGECGVAYDRRFHMPGSDSASSDPQLTTRNLWYSFDHGAIHFIIMSSEHDFTVNSSQWNFINSDLSSVDHSITPWIVFSGHRPMYTSSDHSEEADLIEHMRQAIEPLLLKYHVDVCLWAHIHKYERTCGMYDFKCADKDEDAPVHVVIGNAGNTFQSDWETTNNHQYQPDWIIFRTENYGFSQIEANLTHFRFTTYGDQRGELHDEFILLK